jgi:hypothetical protein
VPQKTCVSQAPDASPARAIKSTGLVACFLTVFAMISLLSLISLFSLVSLVSDLVLFVSIYELRQRPMDPPRHFLEFGGPFTEFFFSSFFVGEADKF